MNSKSITLNLNPVLTDELYNKIGYGVGTYSFQYIGGEEYKELKSQPLDGHERRNDLLFLKDEKGIWSHDNFSIILNRSIYIENPRYLFGVDGLVCSDAELGLSLIWTSKTSSQTGVYPICGFNKSNTPLNFGIDNRFSFEFPKRTLRGKVGLATAIYLRTPGHPTAHEKYLANKSGTILGVLDFCTLIIDGSGSIFPIVETNEPGKPLWWVNCNWMDPCIDSFDEDNIRICLNKAHREYKTLITEEGSKWSPLLKDIIASAMQIIIYKIQTSEYWEYIENGQSLEPGSIGHALNYVINTFGWDTGSPERLALSIRQDLDTRIPTEMLL